MCDLLSAAWDAGTQGYRRHRRQQHRALQRARFTRGQRFWVSCVWKWLHFFIQRLFGDAWRVMTIDHVQSSSKGPFKMQFCSDHSWLMLNCVSVVFPLSCFAHVVMLFLVSNVSFVPTQKNWGNVGIFVFLVLKVHLSKSPNSRLLKNYICGRKGFLHFPQIKWK